MARCDHQLTSEQEEIITEWVRRLRSGEKEQGRNKMIWLRNGVRYQYCCLGVLMEMAEEAGVARARKEPVYLGVKMGQVVGFIDENVYPGHQRRVGRVEALTKEVLAWAGLKPFGNLGDVVVGDRSATEWNDIGTPFKKIASEIEREYLK